MFVSLQQQQFTGSAWEPQEGARHLGKDLTHAKGSKCISTCVQHIAQSYHAINSTIWKRDMEFEPGELESS
jgi:hypothetical protein